MGKKGSRSSPCVFPCVRISAVCYIFVKKPLSSSKEDVMSTSKNSQKEEKEKQSPLLWLGLLAAIALLVTGFLSLTRCNNQTSQPEPTATTVSADSRIEGEFAVTSGAPINVSKTTSAEFGQPLPAGREAKGAIYTLAYEGEAPQGSAELTLPGDAGDLKTLDLLGWDGTDWRFVPYQLKGNQATTSANGTLPRAFALAQSAGSEKTTIAVEQLPGREVSDALLQKADELIVGTLTLGPNGELLGEPASVEGSSSNNYLRTTNTGVIVDTVSLSALLANPEAQSKHIADLVGKAFNGGFAGINVDYQGVTDVQAPVYLTFLRDLNSALDAQELALGVTLPEAQLMGEQWQTNGLDLSQVGALADALYLPMPLDPLAYGSGGSAEQLLAWAIQQVDRRKLTLLINASAVDQIGSSFEAVPSDVAISHFGNLTLVQGADQVIEGGTIEMVLDGNATPLEWDGNAARYRYQFSADNQQHTVWLASETSLAQRLALVNDYRVRGALVRGLDGLSDPTPYTQALDSLRGGESPASSAAAVIWTVKDAENNIVASDSSGTNYNFAWNEVNTPGAYTFNAEFALGNNTTPLGSFPFSVEAKPATETTTEGDETATAPEGEESADNTTSEEGESASVATGEGDGTLTIETNFRQGPSFYYALHRTLPQGTEIKILGKTADNYWYNIVPVGDSTEGWVYSQLVALKPGLDINTLAVTGVSPDAVVILPTNTPTAIPTEVTVWPTNTPTRIWPTATQMRSTNTPAPQTTAVASPLPVATATPISTATPVPPPPTFTPIPPTATKVWPTHTPTRPRPTNTPRPAAPPPAAGGSGFELGGQTHTFSNPPLMADVGMKWVKFQHKWSAGDSGSSVADRVANAKAAGFKVLLSMPGAQTYPSSIDFSGYINFLDSVARLNPAPDAIEVWNEMNIDFEWPAGQISPATYVNQMLKPAYQRIKAANPNIIVISGAPAPTGFDNGTNAWADDRYMAGVAAAGGAAYMDCIGVHHNAGATSPSQSTGHPADSGAGHYSWYFGPTLNMYYNAFGGSRKVCFTELGYLSGEDFGGLPPNFVWAGNTSIGEHAQWLAESVSLSANSGKVRMLIIFNIDFTYFDPNGDPQAGFAMIRRDGSCPSCPLIKQVMGR